MKDNILPVTDLYNDYLTDTNHKQQQTPSLFAQTDRNIDFYNGKQWRTTDAGTISKPVDNIIQPLVDTKCSLIREAPTSIVVSAQDTSETDESQSEKERREIAELWTQMIKSAQERLQFDRVCSDGLIDAATTGQFILYTYWNPSITARDGTKGDIDIKIIPMVNVHYANQYSNDIQKQPWIMISYRENIEVVKKMAESYGIDPDTIVEDTNNQYEANMQYQRLGDRNRCTVLIKFKKKNGKISYTIGTRHSELKSITTSLTLYPLSILNYRPQVNSAYSLGDVQQCIMNQIYINTALSLVLDSTMLTAMPILKVKKGTVERVSNKPGSIVHVGAMDDMAYMQPPQMSYDIKLYIEMLKQDTKEMLGISDIITGKQKIENTSAFLAQRQTALSSLNNIRVRYYNFLEDTARIWLDYFTSYYNTPRLTTIEMDGKKELIQVKGDEYKDIMYDVTVDVGTSQMYNELTEVQNLKGLLDAQAITVDDFLEFLPETFITRMTELRDRVTKRQEEAKLAASEVPQEADQAQLIKNEMAKLSPEQAQALQNNPEALAAIQARLQQ